MDLPCYQPIFLSTEKEVKKLQGKKTFLFFVNAYESQIRELFVIDNHQFIGVPGEKFLKSPEYVKYLHQKQNNYTYVYYPWNYTIVKCVKEKDFFRLKTNRNQDLITRKEQLKLKKLKIAVFGLSVGSNISLVLTQAGIGQEYIIADMDQLETTNLNRIIAGIHQIGLNKCIINARKILEDNPFTKVNILPEGINKNILADLLNRKKIDIIIEEIDNLTEKIEIRKLVLKHKIPVLMITDNGDGVVLIVERYDLGYKKFFQKGLSYWNKRLTGIFTPQKAGEIIINDIVGSPQRVAPKMLKSVQKVYAKKLVSWSQLGSAAMLGGVAIVMAIKKIYLNKDKEKFTRKYINLPV